MPLIQDKIDWDSIENVTSSTLKGFNALEFLIRKLEEWDPNYAYGVCPADALPEWQTENWQHLRIEHFGEKNLGNFNNTVALRYNVNSEAGNLKWRKLYIMYMKKSYRERLEKHRQDMSEARHQQRMLEAEEKVKKEVDSVSPADPIGVDRVLEEQQIPADKFSR